ncbi:MAG: hypothetical protein JSW01_03060 [Candidatus Bathyarchaeota archaeon]|nr:MAG: hypothetical protein JSW01_03060 [Candidatus Bathyarchaeota archaeon]
MTTRRIGRPRVPHDDIRSLEYLIVLSNKYEIDPEEILERLFEAQKVGESLRGRFKIECRNKAEGHSFFLLTVGGKMVAQLRLKESLLNDQSRTGTIFKRLVDSNPPRGKAKQTVSNPKIRDLKVGARVTELKAKVVSKKPTQRVQSRWGNTFLFSMAAISDGTAVINLPLWNSQTNMISIGDEVQIKNGKVAVFRGERQLNISRKIGQLNVL